MSQVARAADGLFGWLVAETPPATPSANVVPLRETLTEAAHTQLAGAQSSQDMIALLDALRVAEQPVARSTAPAADDFGDEEATPAASADTTDDFTPTIRELPANGWLIEALHVEPSVSVESWQTEATSLMSEPVEGAVMEGAWTLDNARPVPAESARIIETDNRAELAAEAESSGEPTKAEPASRTLAELAAPMMQAFLGGKARASAAMAQGRARLDAALAEQRAAAALRREEREARREEQARAEAERAELAREEVLRAEAALKVQIAQNMTIAAEAPAIPAAASLAPTELRLPEAPVNEGYSHEAVEALLAIPEARWSATPVAMAAKPVSALPEWLEEKLALHRRWLESEGSEGKRYRYNGEMLAGLLLSAQILSQAQMRGAALSGADLSGAQLDGVDFSEAELSRVNLSGARATGAVFARADLTYADLSGLSAERANFNFADLQGAKMKDARLSGAQLRETNLQGVVAPDVQLRGASMRNVRLFEAIMPGANLEGADMRGALIDRTVFLGASLKGASLKDAQIHDLDYAQTDFTVALDVPQEIQLAALAAERSKLNEARDSVEARFAALQQREARLMANLRVLEHKRHHDGQFEAQETQAIEALTQHASWLKRSAFWWGGVMMMLALVGALTLGEVPLAAINMVLLGSIASFGFFTLTLAGLSLLRVWRARRTLSQLITRRETARALIAEQALQEMSAL